MLNSTIIDLVIFLSFTYFTGSLVLSAVNEALAGVLRWRSAQLRNAIEHLWFDKDWKQFVQDHLVKTPQVESLMKKEGRFPSHIPARNFIDAVMHIVTREGNRYAGISEQIRESNILPCSLKIVLLDMLQKTGGEMHLLEEKLAAFYDTAMNRATTWYKRKIKLVLLAMGFLLAVALNLDTIHIINASLKDKSQLTGVAANIGSLISRTEAGSGSVTIRDDAGNTVLQVQNNIDTIGGNTSRDALTRANNIAVTYRQTTGVTLGYEKGFITEWKGNFFTKLLGIIITAFALQLGADYWFRLMNRAVSIQSTRNKTGQHPSQQNN
jgi:hypothetical protein